MFYTYLDMANQPASQAPSHRGIITRNGGPAKLARLIAVDPNTVKAWNRLDSIPAPHWQAITDAGAASLDELALAAARKVPAEPKAQAAA